MMLDKINLFALQMKLIFIFYDSSPTTKLGNC